MAPILTGFKFIFSFFLKYISTIIGNKTHIAPDITAEIIDAEFSKKSPFSILLYLLYT